MSEPLRRRVRHHAGNAPTQSANPSRVILRRRRCNSEPLTQRRVRRERQGGAWRQFSLVGLVLLAAGPVWALGEAVAERYHEEIAQIFHRRSAPVAWVVPAHDWTLEAVRLATPGMNTASHGAGDTLTSRRYVALSGAGASAKTETLPASAYSRAVPVYQAPSFAPLAFHTASVFEARGVSRPATVAGARASTAAAVGSATWSGASSTASPSDPSWQTGNNWVGGTAPAPAGNADIVFTPTPAGATASNVNVNYTIGSLTFQGPAGGSAMDTPSYKITGSSGVTLTVGAGGINDASANKQTLTVPVVLGAAQTWSVANSAGNLEVDGVVSGTGALTKFGPGTLILGGSGNNTYTGLTSVTGGTLALAKTASNITAIPGDLSIGNATNPGAPGSAVVQLRNFGQTAATSNVTIYPDGLFDLANGSGTGQANNGTQIKNLTMTGGEVRIGAGDIFLSTLTTNASATSALISSTNSYDNVQLSAGVTANVAPGTATYDLDVQAGMANGTLTKTGDGVMRLAGNTNGGHNGSSITLEAGTIALANNSALGEKPDVTGPSVFTFAGGTLVADGGDRTVANPIALTGDATIGASLDGTPRAFTFTGATTLTGSRTLTVNNTAATTFSGAVNVGANTLTMDGTGNTLISGVVGDGGAGGGLTKESTGTLTLTANNTYTGTTDVRGGALMVTNVPVKQVGSGTGSGSVFVESGAWLGGTGTIGGNVTVGGGPGFSPPPAAIIVGAGSRFSMAAGTLTPGVAGPGVLTINGGVSFTSSGMLEVDIAGANPGTGYDQVKVGGSLTLAGSLTFNPNAGVTLTKGETFYIFDLTSTAGKVNGTFENAGTGGTFTDAAGDVYAINYAATDPADGDGVANDVSLTVLGVPEPGTWAMLGLGLATMMMGRAAARRRAGAC